MKRNGFTLVEIMIVVAIVGLLVAIAIPSFVKARQNTQKDVCLNNLRQIDSAKSRWALETGTKSGDPCVAADIEPYIEQGAVPTCPTGYQEYTINGVAEDPLCNSGIAGHAL